ncbi:MAG TPA: response regulator, partial [Rhizobacter sp.]|nr:response regulator [Rhizobacter sp.]
MVPDPDEHNDADEPANILIVDDLPEKLLVFGTVLEDLGQNLVFVRSGSEALREVLQREFAVILLDVNMPDIDGFETAGLIRRYKKSAHTPIIFITAYADEI